MPDQCGPSSGTGELRLAGVSARWGSIGELRLEGSLATTPPTNGLPQADAQWAWWGALEPYFMDWNCQLKNIHAEDNAQKFDLQELDCAGLWRAPELAVTNLHAAMYRGQLNAHTTVNVATRALVFGCISDFWTPKNLAVPDGGGPSTGYSNIPGSGPRSWRATVLWSSRPGPTGSRIAR